MKQLCLLVLCVLSLTSATAQHKWKLVWADEFNHTGLPDTANWTYDTGGWGWGNDELQYYTDHKENCRVENGHLIIEARKETIGNNKYTSARLVTRGKHNMRYGKVEVRAKLPAGRGTWPAIWLLGAPQPMKWPDDGEVDIMEHVGYDPGFIHATIHCTKYNHMLGNAKSATIPAPDCTTAFHTYAAEWDSASIRILIDGKKYFTYANEHTGKDAWPFDGDFYLLLNVAIGGSWGGTKGVDDTIFPQRMEVDYVRVYERK